MHRHLEEKSPQEVDDRHALSAARVEHGQPPPRGAVAEVRRAEESVARLEERNQVAVPPDVVPRRDRISARREDLLGQLGGQADAVCGVLAVDDAEVDVELVPQLGQLRLDRPPPRRPEDVTEEEDAQLGPF
jgi:hypothetical protein